MKSNGARRSPARPMTLKFPLLLLALASFCRAASAEVASSATADDVLYAIRQVESGDRYDGPPGSRGELGAYQFRRQVWYQHTREPFDQARTAYADKVAADHYRWIAGQLSSAGLTPTPWNIAAAWNSGLTAVRSQRIPRSTRDYANRVDNLVHEKVALRQALTPHFRIAADSK